MSRKLRPQATRGDPFKPRRNSLTVFVAQGTSPVNRSGILGAGARFRKEKGLLSGYPQNRSTGKKTTRHLHAAGSGGPGRSIQPTGEGGVVWAGGANVDALRDHRSDPPDDPDGRYRFGKHLQACGERCIERTGERSQQSRRAIRGNLRCLERLGEPIPGECVSKHGAIGNMAASRLRGRGAGRQAGKPNEHEQPDSASERGAGPVHLETRLRLPFVRSFTDSTPSRLVDRALRKGYFHLRGAVAGCQWSPRWKSPACGVAID
jgi:hypothetical protein